MSADELMETESDRKKNKKSAFENFSRIATVIGFINDTFGLIALLYSSIILLSTVFFAKVEGKSPTFLFTSVVINHYHILALWVISLFLFLGLLRKEWEVNQKSKNYTENFRGFLLNDVFLGFRLPLFSLLTGILVVVFLWSYISILVSTLAVQLITVSICIIVVVTLGIYFENKQEKKQKREAAVRELTLMSLRKIDDDWQMWEERIQEQLRTSWFVSASCLDDIVTAHNILPQHVERVLTKYALLHPRQVNYGYVYFNRNNHPTFFADVKGIKEPIKVLVVLSKLQTDVYSFSSMLIHDISQ
jgi:hypothetical protein